MPPAGRPEKPIDATAGPLARLAGELRRLRGGRTYRQLSEATGLSVTTLRAAAAGERLPTWSVTRQYAAACDADEDAVRELWEDAGAAGGRPLPNGDPPEFGIPDPAAATTVEDFVAMLRRLRTWAGDPSLAELDKRSGGHGRLPPSTVSDMLRNQYRLPRLDLVLTFARACGLDDGQAAAWERSWVMLRALESIPGQSGPGQVLPPQAPWGRQVGTRSASQGLLLWAAGARPEILARCPTDRGTYTALGTTVLLAAALAALSAAYALHIATGMPLIAACLAGIVWGGIITSLDRTLVVSIQRGRGRRNLLAIAPRLLLGLILGAIISVPVVMQIFRPEINYQIVVTKQEESAAFTANIPGSAIGRQISALQARFDHEQQEAGTFYSQWQCQEFGRPSCTQDGHGPGPLAAAAEQGYKTATAAATAINAQLRQLQAYQSETTSQYEMVLNSNVGLLARLAALEQAAGHNSALMIVQVLFFVLFATVEFLPVIVRMVHVTGPQNTYEKILRMQELADIRAASEYSGNAVRTRGVRP
jgi:transcriptional regulator with XRE-family HTH domain